MIKSELWSTYFNPLLSCLISDPDRLVHLRWTNTTSNEKGKSWPDVVVSETPRLVFGGSAAYGEARTQQGSRSKLLCLDTLRLAISTKKIKTVTFPSRTDNFAEELIGVANGLLDLVVSNNFFFFFLNIIDITSLGFV